MDENETPKPMGQVIQIDEARIRDHLGEMVRGTVFSAQPFVPPQPGQTKPSGHRRRAR
jgi:hypothetical protein